MEIEKSVIGSVRLDSDVWEAVRGMPCSLNLYLRENLLSGIKPARKLSKKERLLEELAAIDRLMSSLGTLNYRGAGSVSQLDAVGPQASSGRGKATVQTFRREIRQKGDKGR